MSTCDAVSLDDVRDMIGRDVPAADILFSVFYSAVRSYRRDTLVRPFPDHFKVEGSTEGGAAEDPHNFERLMEAAEALPPMASLMAPTDGAHTTVLDGDALVTVGWLISRCPLRLNTLSPAMYEPIQAKSGAATYKLPPDHIFGVEHREPSPRSRRFDELAKDHGVITCYHGTALENFHSILMNGFLSHFNKAALYGEGTYFSTDLSVCMGFIAAGQAWGKSAIGSKLSCVAVCDVVKHPSVTLPGGVVRRDLDRASSVGGDRAPDTYVVVPNNDHIRIRYLFVYAEQTAAPATAVAAGAAGTAADEGEGGPRSARRCCSGLRATVARNRFAVSLMCYALMLVVISLWNSRSFRRWVVRAMR